MSQGKYITSNLYAVLRDNGINMPTEEVFYQNMSDPNYRKTLHKGLQEKGFDTESENEFQVSWHNKFANDPNYKGSGKATSKPVAKSQQSQPTQQSSQRMLSGQRVPKQQHIERVETTRSATPKAVALYTPNTKSQIKTNEDVALESQPKPKIERPKVDNTEQATKLKSSIETQQDEIKAKIEDAERRRMEAVREYNKKNRFLSAFVASAQQDAGVDPFASGAYGEEVTKITEEIQSLRNQLKRMTDAHDKIATALETKKGDGLFDLQNFKNIGRGIADTFTDSDFWDMGRGEFNANTQMMGISKKIEQGKELTDDELNVVSTELINQSVDQYIQSIGGLPIGYSVGQVTAEATRFMLEMGINPARGASSAITQQLVKKLGVDGIKNIIAKRLATGAIKAVGNVAEAGALVNTMQSMRTAGDAAKRYAGTIDIDNDGNLTVVDNQGMGEALYKAEASAIIENVTELMGGGKLAELTNKGFNAAVKRLGDVISLGKISDFAGKMSATGFGRFVDGMAKRGAWQGFADEVFEEEYGIMLNSLLVGDSSFSDLVDPKQQAEIVLGCAFMDGSIKAVKVGGGAIEYRNVSKKYRKAESKAKSLFTPEQWEMISSNLGGATDAEMGAMLATYLDPNTGLFPEQRQAVAEYAGSMVRYRSFNRMADNVKEESKQQSSATTPTLAYEVDSDVSLIDDNGDTINGHITGVDEDGNYMVETNTPVNGKRVQPMSADQLDAMGNTNGNEIVDGVQTSTAEGYDITDFDQIGELSMLVDNSRDDVAQALGTTDVDAVLQQALGNNPTDSDIDAQFGDNAQVVKEYVHNRAKLNGSRQRNDDDLDIAIESIDSDIANIANTNGNVVAAKLVGEDGDVYVVDGNIVTYEDGQIDVANSDASVIIQKADGSREMVTPLQLQDIVSTPTEQYRDELVQAFTDNHRQAYDDAVNSALDYSQGQQYTMLNADGSTIDVTILADNGDGNVTVTARDGNKEGGVTDGKQIVLPKSQIQQGVREFKRNQLRGETAQQASIPQAESQPTKVAEPKQESTTPTDEQGNVAYEDMDADSAWDRLVAESGDDVDIATMVAQSNIEDAQKALDKAKKQTPKLVGTTEEKLATAKAFKESVVKAQNDLAKWQEIADVPKRRASLQTESQGQQVTDKLPASEKVGPQANDTENVENPTLLDVVRTLYSKGKDVASKLFSMKFFDVAKTPDFMQDLGLRGEKFTIKYGVISRHFGKDGSHNLSERDWKQLPDALQNPFAIARLTDREDSYRIYTTLQTESGEYIVVGADVKNAGRDIEVNAISTAFGRRTDANLPQNEEVIYRSNEITPEQSSLLDRPNFGQYPTEQELSADKGSNLSSNNKENSEKVEEEKAKKEADKKAKQLANTFAGTYQQLGEPMTFEEFVLRELSSGKIKFIWGDNTNNTKGLSSHLGYHSEAERKQRLWMLDNQRGERPEVVAQGLLEDARAQYNLGHNIDDMDALNVLLDIVATYPTARSMFDEVVAMHKRAEEAEERYYRELEEQDIYNTYHMSIEEYRDYCDVVEEEIKQKYLIDKEYDEYNNIYVESALNEQKAINNEDNQRNDQRRTDGIRTSGNGVLQEEQSDSPRGNRDIGEDGRSEADDNGNSENAVAPEGEQVGYSITPTTYVTKANKVLDMHLLVFDRPLGKEEHKSAREIAKSLRGWYDAKEGGYMMRSEEDAKSLANAMLDKEVVESTQPVSLSDVNDFMAEEPKKESKPTEAKPSNPSGNKLVTDERYAELRERMRKKLGGQMNMGIDPEILAIGTEMAVYHIEKGARKFKDYATDMIADLGDAIRPYLKAFYNGARELPEVEDAGFVNDMTPYEEVKSFDVANFDKVVPNPLDTADAIAKEAEVEKQAEEATEKIKDARNDKRIEFINNLHSGDRVILKDGRNVLISIVMHRGEQVLVNNAFGYTKPTAERFYATHKGELIDFTPDKIDVDATLKFREDLTSKTSESTEKSVPLQDNKLHREFVKAVTTDMISALDTNERPYRSIVDIRKRAKEVGIEVDSEGRDDILLQELVEDGLVRAAKIANISWGGAKYSRRSFDEICQLYAMQPTIAQRSSNRIKMQQYSTPLPMAWVANHFAMHGKKDGKVLEPTAGNGMLVFSIPPKQVHVNELDETRLANLREQGFAEVTQQDATEPFEGGKQYDVVLANPPFGKRDAVEFDGDKISGLDPQITLNALDVMKDNGRAAIIIGGNFEYRPNGAIKDKPAFWSHLYNHYNVVGVVDMSGDMYARQGTTFPTRMILINGRRSEEDRKQGTCYPPVQADAVRKAETFDDLYEIVNELIEFNLNNKTNGTIISSEGLPSKPVSDKPQGKTGQVGHRRQSKKGDSSIEQVQGGLDSGTENPLVAVLGNDNANGEQSRPDKREDDRSGNQGNDVRVELEGGNATEGSGVRTRTDSADGGRYGGIGRQRLVDSVNDNIGTSSVRSSDVLVERKLDTEKLPYRPHNTAFSLESVAPAHMVEAMDAVLSDIESQYGNIDQFVTDELGYNSVDEMHNALAAEQVDSVAMAIYQMKQGKAMIIGDQTGVGKGRQMASLIRWAVKQGKTPIFATQKADLFSDIYRDLVDIGSGDLIPFIFNARTGKNKGEMVDANGEVVHRGLPDAKMKEVLKAGVLPEGYDFVVLTYSQVNNGPEHPKAKLLANIAKDNYLFLDESHTAAGESKTGECFQKAVASAKAVTFASATYAKRPDTMPLYALRTSMNEANVGMDELIDIIKRGGVTLQEIMSRELTNAGQMVRRERDMSDVVTDWVIVDDANTSQVARDNYDRTINAFNAIIKFQEDYVNPTLKGESEKVAREMKSISKTKGTDKVGIDNTPFASHTFNYTKQLMLALKVDAIIDYVDREIKAGRHPVIALENTMESSYKDFNDGEELDDTSFSRGLLKGLDSTLKYTIKNNGDQIPGILYPYQLIGDGEAKYYELQKFIYESTKDIFISPLDAIIDGLHRKGYKVGELTGRSKVVSIEGDKAVVRNRKDTDKKKLQREFNSGLLDVLILNKSAATGISLHASERFSDQRQRTMILVQPLSDINDYMQMIGRIDRTGQVHRGYYINLGLPIPAENRFLMMLSTKLKSLNANTTTSQDSESNEVKAPDLLNKYGGQVIIEYLRDNPDVYVKIGEPLSGVSVDDLETYTANDETASKITGRVALLTIKEQEDFYDDVIRRYNDLINYLNDTGTNDLKINVVPLRAETIAKRVTSSGKDPNGNNPFAQDAYLEKVEMDVIRKPMKSAEVQKTIEKVNDGLSPDAHLSKIADIVTAETSAKVDKEVERHNKATERVNAEIESHTKKVNKMDKLSEEEKQKVIEDYANTKIADIADKHSANLSKLRDAQKVYFDNLKLFTTGDTYLIPDNLETLTYSTLSPAIFCGYKTKDSKITASTTFAVFAVLDGRRKIEIKLSEMSKLKNIYYATMQNIGTAKSTNLSNWDSQMPNETRREGYILTGNILQAVADTMDENGNYTGQLVSYTDIDGNVRDGVLMPDNWNPKLLKSGKAPLISKLTQIKNGERVESSDGDVVIAKNRWGYTYTLSVPKTKKRGGKFFEDTELLNLVSNGVFYPNRGRLQADVISERIDRVVQRLTELDVKVEAEKSEDDVMFRTSEEIEAEYPNWLEGTTTDSGKHSTQVEGTRKTYNKVGTWIENNLGKDVSILDASSGMGYGTLDLRERGFNIEDVEPYQSEERKQSNPATYSSYDAIGKEYDYIISNAVLNVIPDDWRANVLHDMAKHLKAGGRMFINTRKAGEEKHIKDKIELDSPQEVLVKRNGKIASYQRFFTPSELKAWVESELGDGYSVDVANEKNSGTKGLAAVVVTKNALTEEEQRVVDEAKANGTYLKAPNGKASNLNERQWIQVRTKAFKDWFGDWENDPENASKVVDENGEPMVVYHGTWKSRGENYDLWNPKNGAPFYTFNADSHFGTEEQAENIINSKRRRMEEYDNDYSGFSWTYPVFLNIRNIKEVYDANLKWDPIIKEAKGEGYDGLSYENEHEGHGMSYIAFEPTQIKSATDNVGMFDASNRDIRHRQGEGAYTDAEVSFANDLVSRAWGENLRSKKQQQSFANRIRKQMRQHAQNLAETLRVPVEILDNPNGLTGKKARAKGFYDKKTGKATVILSNNNSLEDIEATVLHELVGHYGLRELFGENFDRFLYNVYTHAEADVKERINRLARKNNWDFAKATEEYLASLAEDESIYRNSQDQTRWLFKIKRFFMEMLRTLGFNYLGPSLSDNELKYVLWCSYQNLQGELNPIFKTASDVAMQSALKVGQFEEQTPNRALASESREFDNEPDVLLRDTEDSVARDMYERKLASTAYQSTEAFQDSMLGLKVFQDAVLEANGKGKEAIADFENAYMAENALSSKNYAQTEEFKNRLFIPLVAEMARLEPSGEYGNLYDYMMAKHGLERNRVMAERDAEAFFENYEGEETFEEILAKFRKNDYSGLTSLTGEEDVENAEEIAYQMVEDYEKSHNTSALWDKINACTADILKKQFEGGLISRDTYNQISAMYENYIPLRGWKETTADDVYTYLTSKSGAFNAPIRTARGRSSVADNPIATIAHMAESGIAQANRNKLKQQFYNFCLNNPSNLASISDVWLQYNPVTDEWEVVSPQIDADATAEEVEQIMSDFNERMKSLAEENPDEYKKGSQAKGIPYKIGKGVLSEHQVLVKVNGKDIIITINGNPRAAQAVNGLTNPDSEMSGAIGNLLKLTNYVNRQLSAFYTTRNPEFVVSNFFRDAIYANSMVWVKESPNYAVKFNSNFGKVNPAKMHQLIRKYRNGSLDMSNEIEKAFYDFMINGGETGYTQMRDLEAHKKELDKALKYSQGKMPVRKAWNMFFDRCDEINRAVENCARFAAFVTSRQMGRTIQRSVYDAKEISVNFNKKGAGDKFLKSNNATAKWASLISGVGRMFYVFWNAGIQGMANFAKVSKNNPKGAIVACAAMFVSGALVAMLGYDDEERDYYNLPEYVRRSNLCFKVGNSWVTIPLPIEYRAIYGLGELCASVINGGDKYTPKETAEKVAQQFSQLLPLDMLEGGGGWNPLIPTFAKPWAEAYVFNTDWTGLPIYKENTFNELKPEFTKAYKNTNDILVGISEYLNSIDLGRNGNAAKKGDIDINPAKLEYVLEGYFGGLATTFNKMVKMGETAFGDREFEWRNMLIASRLVKEGDERQEAKRVQNQYYNYKQEAEETSNQLSHFRGEKRKGILDNADELDFLHHSPEYLRYTIFNEYDDDITALNKKIKEMPDGKEKDNLIIELDALRKELVDQLDATRDLTKEDVKQITTTDPNVNYYRAKEEDADYKEVEIDPLDERFKNATTEEQAEIQKEIDAKMETEGFNHWSNVHDALNAISNTKGAIKSGEAPKNYNDTIHNIKKEIADMRRSYFGNREIKE